MLVVGVTFILGICSQISIVCPASSNVTASPADSACQETQTYNSGAFVYHIFTDCRGDYRAASASAPSVTTFWTASAINLPGLDSELFLGGSCGLLSFGENPLSELPQVNWTLTNDCQSIEETYPWLCEVLVADYSVTETLTKSEVKETGSVMDYRPSAICIGTGGLAFLMITAATIIILDLQRLVSSLRFMKSNVQTTAPGTDEYENQLPACLDQVFNAPVVTASGWTSAIVTRKISQFSRPDFLEASGALSVKRMPTQLSTSDVSLQHDEGFSSSRSSVAY
ncbi:hypothetical protein ElyMa_001018200 [Elysia marginata]|uniref:C-type lectin domain-containing protein n=1 Tax=Elysia marginata TaxID=1093978 RepID=A0AAV4HL23_9GAST|nr:hypothetical protein ElyMa_001018200 [Elysia marginata]